jgi:hypothetical protein
MVVGTLEQRLGRMRRFVQAMDPSVDAVDTALPAVRKLLGEAQAPFKLVGGLAVVHHGYLRATEDIDVLIDPAALDRVDALLDTHGFVREARDRLRHIATNVRVDLLLGGSPMPRPGAPVYPMPQRTAGAADEPTVIAMAPLCALKLHARRHQDLADVVALLKNMDDAAYTDLEASLDADLRPLLWQLRRDALEELAWT